MSPYKKNLLVGLTMLVALLMLGWLMLQFGGALARPFATPRMPIHFRSDRADGLDQGSAVTFRGVRVGAVTNIKRTSDERWVIINAEVDRDPPLPANLDGSIHVVSAIGAGSAINLEMTGLKPEGTLKEGAELEAHFVGLGLIPTEFSEVAIELREAVRQFRQSNLVADLDEAVKTGRVQFEKAGKLMESMDNLVSDKQMQQDIRQSMANIRNASDTATRVTANLERFSGDLQTLSADAGKTLHKAQDTIDKTSTQVDALSKQMSARLEQVAKLLESFQSISGKIDEGKGTAGLLVNDPKLYQGLVDTTRELNLAIKDIQRLVEQWEQEGASIRLGK